MVPCVPRIPTWRERVRVPTASTVGRITPGTIRSKSYELEIAKFHPDIVVTGQACPMWVPLVEYGEYASPGADYFVQQRLQQILSRDPQIDTLVLACTHYPLLMDKIVKYLHEGVRVRVPTASTVGRITPSTRRSGARRGRSCC